MNQICRVLGISKATYYHNQNPTDKFEAKYLNIKSFITKVIDKHSAYGVNRIKAELEETYQIKVGRDTLLKLLKLWRLSLRRKVSRKHLNPIQKILISLSSWANLLIRIKLEAPFQAITSDMTTLLYRGGKAHLCVHKDAYGQMVHGWSLDLSMETNLVIKSLTMATQRIYSMAGRLNHKLIYHQDRGRKYTSHQYVEVILKVGIISYSDPGTPTHNPGQESFYGRLKMSGKVKLLKLRLLRV